MSSRHLVLLGLMGAGKTSVAVRVAALLDRPVRDSDLDLAERYGMTAATFMERYGRTALHAWEVDHLTRAMAEPPAAVIAPAASVVEDPGCRALLADAYVVWLDAPVEVLARRAARGVHRPWDGSDPVTVLASQRARRARWLAELANLTVDTTDATPADVSRLVVAEYARADDP